EAIEAAAHAAMAFNEEQVASAVDNLEIDDDGAIENAIESLATFLKAPHSDAQIFDEVARQQTFAALPVMDRLSIFFGAAFTGDILTQQQIPKYAAVLEKIIDNERLQFQLIALVEHFCAIKFPTLLNTFPVVLKHFYDEDLVAEDTILAWSVDETRKNYAHYEITPTQAAALKKALAPFVEWLENAEEESDEE
ncbi:eukaryotic translation initiation factor 5, partial [Thraustotheca clavata]